MKQLGQSLQRSGLEVLLLLTVFISILRLVHGADPTSLESGFGQAFGEEAEGLHQTDVFNFRNRFTVDEDSKRNVSELIRSRGYDVEEHVATTPDGFLLSLQRIAAPNPRSSRPRIVFLMHGLLCSSTFWVEDFPRNSLGYILADAGYDVWLGNSRGNVYSSTNIHCPAPPTRCNTKLLWDWSWDEMAHLDLPTMLYYVLNTTAADSIAYVAHSQGCTQAFASFSADPHLASRISAFIALAPAVFMRHSRSPLLSVLARLRVDRFYSKFGYGAFAPSNALIRFLFPEICTVAKTLCADILFSVVGWDTGNLNLSRLAAYVGHSPAGTSVKNMAHWAQSLRSGRFQAFDYGWYGNLRRYGSRSPPQYTVSNLSCPVAVFAGTRDSLSSFEDVVYLLDQLPNSTIIHTEPGYNHLDFVIGADAHERIFPHVLEILKRSVQ